MVKCECPTDNKQAYLFILWIYKSYGLFFSTTDSH